VRALAVQIAGLKSSLHAGYPARAKVLAKTRMWDEREAAHCTRPVVALSTANTRQRSRATMTASVVEGCG
jgi:hypothetical protein